MTRSGKISLIITSIVFTSTAIYGWTGFWLTLGILFFVFLIGTARKIMTLKNSYDDSMNLIRESLGYKERERIPEEDEEEKYQQVINKDGKVIYQSNTDDWMNGINQYKYKIFGIIVLCVVLIYLFI
tara:strand:+ start:82 stop:462 length:381 start_codon:yes stop_codon:yes gene_type:complete